MPLTNALIQAVAPSATLTVAARAKELQKQGRSICDLGAGELDIDTPQHIKAAAVKALQEGKTKYTMVAGIPELRGALARKFTEENSIPAAAENVIVTNGGKQAIHQALQVCLEPGDEVIIFAPYWVSYPAMAALAGARPVIVPAAAEQGYKVKPAQLAQALTARTKMVIVNSPNNPTGAGYTRSEQAALGEVLAGSNALVLSDEVYEKIVFPGFEFYSFAAACPQLSGRTITVNSFSKSHAMSGWRVGYATGPAEIISAMIKYQGQTTTNVNTIAQHAALAALQGPVDFLAEVRASLGRRLELFVSGIKAIPGMSLPIVPVGTFYIFISIAGLLTGKHQRTFRGSLDFAAALLEEAGVAVVPGLAFGDDHAVRVSISSADENLQEALKRMQTFAASVC